MSRSLTMALFKKKEVEKPQYCFGRGCPKEIPLFLKLSFEYLEKDYLDMEGIFRIPGDAKSVKRIKQELNDGEEKYDCSKEYPTTVAAIIKLYFNELGEPLITTSLYDEFLLTSRIQDKNSRLKELHYLLFQLPKENFQLLKLLCGFLKKVSKMSEENKMSAENLAMVFAPSIQIKEPEDEVVPMDQNLSMEEIMAVQKEAQKRSQMSMKVLKDIRIIMTIFIEEYKLLFETKPIQKVRIHKVPTSLDILDDKQPLRSSSFEVKDLETDDFISQVQKNRRQRRKHTTSFVHQIEKK
eukprot:gene4737-8320_t